MSDYINQQAWRKEKLWVARDANGQIVRVMEDSPEELLRLADDLRGKSN